MPYMKIKGSGWCEHCGCERPAFFTRLVQYDDKQEVQGTCSLCNQVVRRDFLVSGSSTPDPVPDSRAEPIETKEHEPLVREKEKAFVPSNNRPTLLGLLLAACCLLWIDQYLLWERPWHLAKEDFGRKNTDPIYASRTVLRSIWLNSWDLVTFSLHYQPF